jgi:GNAT superfamily N-acetyltransferase
MIWIKENYSVSTDNTMLQLSVIHENLAKSSWAEGIAIDVVKKALENSLNFGLYEGARQIGYGRFITDYATFAYMADVFVIDEFRGKGLGRWLVECMLNTTGVDHFRRIILATSTASWLYAKLGFLVPTNPNLFWQINRPDIYKKPV